MYMRGVRTSLVRSEGGCAVAKRDIFLLIQVLFDWICTSFKGKRSPIVVRVAPTLLFCLQGI